jgi:nanoRNase/pAp phosphatase (c-di-AMP/oligoRNAs hydrolase)
MAVPGPRPGFAGRTGFSLGLQQAERVVFVSHINPDPDSLGSMLGLAHLVETRLNKPTLMTRDGLVSRAENRTMVEVLDLDLVPVDQVDWRPSDAVVMVDSQPNTGRHTFTGSVPLYAVIDHHDTPGDLDGIPFTDIRATHGATCTLATKYLIEQDVPIPERVATALLYGIETEVTGYPREAGPSDDEALLYLYPLADKDQVAQIRNARLPH